MGSNNFFMLGNANSTGNKIHVEVPLEKSCYNLSLSASQTEKSKTKYVQFFIVYEKIGKSHARIILFKN